MLLNSRTSLKEIGMRMRLIALLLAIFVVTLSGRAQKVQGYLESENVITPTAAKPQINLLAYGPIVGKVGWQFWGIASRAWSEAYIGPSYSPTSWLTLAAGAGAETGGARFSGSASGKKGRLFYLSVHEWGQGSGRWQKNVGTVDLGPRVALGVWHETGRGVGPTVSVTPFKGFHPYVTVFGSVSGDGPSALVGATYDFSWGRVKE